MFAFDQKMCPVSPKICPTRQRRGAWVPSAVVDLFLSHTLIDFFLSLCSLGPLGTQPTTRAPKSPPGAVTLVVVGLLFCVGFALVVVYYQREQNRYPHDLDESLMSK
jgi:hypothetical protein